MKGPHVRIELVDGTCTNVTVMPIRQKDGYGVQLATAEAFALFMRGLVMDEGELAKRLALCES